MSKYKVNVHTPMKISEIIEAEEKMFNMIMDNVGFYLDIVAEEIEEEEDE